MEPGFILSLGSINVDFQVRIDQKPGDTTTMLAHHFIRLGGGKAANVAYVARRLGIPSLLMGRVGRDDLGDQALLPLREAGVDLTYVGKVEDASTGVSMIAVPPDGKKQIILAPNANDEWEEKDLDGVRKAVGQAPKGSVLVVDYEVPPFVVEQAILTACNMGFHVIVDPSPPDRVDQRLFPKISYLMPDASETEGLTGIRPDSVDNGVQAAQKLMELGVKTAVVRLEEGGCVVMNGHHTLHVPPVPVEVVDLTGAGDAFVGAFAVAVLERQSLRDALCFASAVSHSSITVYGSQPAYPSREGIRQLYERINANVRHISL